MSDGPQVGGKDKELTGALLFNEQDLRTKYKICVIPTWVLPLQSLCRAIDFTVAELEVFLKLEVFPRILNRYPSHNMVYNKLENNENHCRNNNFLPL